MDDLLEFLEAVDWDKYKVVINIAGGLVIAGKEIIDILKKSGMNQIEYLEIANIQDARITAAKIRLEKSIEDRS